MHSPGADASTVVAPGRCLDQRIEDCALDALAGAGPDELARNTVKSSRDWRDRAAKREAGERR